MSDTILSKPFPMDVHHPLDDTEALELSDRAEEIEEQADELVEELKDETKERKDKIRKLRAEAKKLRAASKSRRELRSTQVYRVLRGSQVFTLIVGTDRVVDQRAATSADQQTGFPGLDTSDDTEPVMPDGELVESSAGDMVYVTGEDGLPLEPDYTPSEDAPKVETEEKPKRGKRK